MLSQEEKKRYSRQIQLAELKTEGQQKLQDAKVLVVGAGGLGCPVLQYLAAAGVGTIGIVDFDLVEETNLHRQVLYATADVGKSKAEIASKRILEQNPLVKVEIFNTKLDNSNALKIISNYQIVLDCSDNFETRYAINDACVYLNKPFVYAGIHKFEGQLSVFNLDKESPTYRCVFPEKGEDEIIINCSITGVIGTLPGILGTMQANEVIKIITGIGEVCSGKMLLFNALNNSLTEVKVRRNVKYYTEVHGGGTEVHRGK
jgi:sulfur-carrier protein adenylyltransferase/sulfurtransferase